MIGFNADWLGDAIRQAGSQPGDYGPVGGVLKLGSGRHRLSKNVVIGNSTGLIIEGEGDSTIIEYYGPPNVPIFDCYSLSRCEFRRLNIVNRSGAKVSSAFRVRKPTPASAEASTYPPTSCLWEKVIIGEIGDPFAKGYDINSQATGAFEGNNDLHVWRSCWVSSYDTAWYLNGPNVHNLKIEDCHMFGNGTSTGVWANGAGFWKWLDGEGYNNAIDFYVDTFFMKACVRGYNSENSKKLFGTSGTSTAPLIVELSDIRWAGTVPTDTEIVSILCPGPLEWRNNLILPQNNIEPLVALHAPTYPGTINASNSHFAYGFAPTRSAFGSFTPGGIVKESGVIYQNTTTGVMSQYSS